MKEIAITAIVVTGLSLDVFRGFACIAAPSLDRAFESVYLIDSIEFKLSIADYPTG